VNRGEEEIDVIAVPLDLSSTYLFQTIVPESVDIISIDIYPDESKSVWEAQQLFENNLYPLMKLPTQKAMYVPPAYSAYNSSDYYRDDLMTQWAQDAINWVMTDSQLVGLLPWHWDDLPESLPGIEKFAEGLVSMTEAQSVWIPFGQLVRSQNFTSAV